jgi:hypothetical protein
VRLSYPVVLLLKHFGVLSDHVANASWPVLVILYGLKKAFGQGKCRCCPSA